MAHSKLKEYFKENKSPQERKLVRKLDFFILTFCCLAYFVYVVEVLLFQFKQIPSFIPMPKVSANEYFLYSNYLDRASISQAYVSRMKEDLNFQGNQLTVVTTVYSCGYLL